MLSPDWLSTVQILHPLISMQRNMSSNISKGHLQCVCDMTVHQIQGCMVFQIRIGPNVEMTANQLEHIASSLQMALSPGLPGNSMLYLCPQQKQNTLHSHKRPLKLHGIGHSSLKSVSPFPFPSPFMATTKVLSTSLTILSWVEAQNTSIHAFTTFDSVLRKNKSSSPVSPLAISWLILSLSHFPLMPSIIIIIHLG